jgi:hypothetical protein
MLSEGKRAIELPEPDVRARKLMNVRVAFGFE